MPDPAPVRHRESIDTAELVRRDVVARLGTIGAFSDPANPATLLELFRLLYATGRADLPVGRLVEGHIDALQIVTRYGSGAQVLAAHASARRGEIFGVWNADPVDNALRINDDVVSGTKTYASGAGIVGHALVTADSSAGRRLLLIDCARTPPVIDREWWDVIGMRRSNTHRVRWSGLALGAAEVIGEPDCYAREPFFSGGALRFVAVQAGGVAALFDQVRAHLLATGRGGDPHQLVRIARLFVLAQSAASAVRDVAASWHGESDDVRLPRVSAARLTVADAADEAMTIAQQCVGLPGMFTAHPLSATLADLMVYLRQPGPDAQRERAGAAALQGTLRPAL